MITFGTIVIEAEIALSGNAEEQKILLAYLQRQLASKLEIFISESSRALMDGEVSVSFITTQEENDGK
jgi:hypothetical protein